MSAYALRLVEDCLPGDHQALLSPGPHRVVYVVEGTAEIAAGAPARTFGPDSAWYGTASGVLRAGPQGARLWRWELLNTPSAEEGQTTGEGLQSTVKQYQQIELAPAIQYLMRCDRVDFPPGGIAYTHTHPGPGIRCLLRGELRVQVRGEEFRVHPGESWFERGPDPVLALACATHPTSFVRAMLLPRAFKGRSSIHYVVEEDREKPKTQEYTRFVDELIEL